MPAWTLFVVIEASAGSFRPTTPEVHQRLRAGVTLDVVDGDLACLTFAIAEVGFVPAVAVEMETLLMARTSECRQVLRAGLKSPFFHSLFFWWFCASIDGGETGSHRIP
jgi:hypothetical protein